MPSPSKPAPSKPAGSDRTVSLVTLGCARNEVDSEELAARLTAAGWELTSDGDASVVLVNTCGFIQAAKQESISELLAAAESGAKVAAVGCLAERYGAELAGELPEAQVLSFDDYAEIGARLRRRPGRPPAPRAHRPGPPHPAPHQPRRPPAFACTYLPAPRRYLPPHAATSRPTPLPHLTADCDRRPWSTAQGAGGAVDRTRRGSVPAAAVRRRGRAAEDRVRL